MKYSAKLAHLRIAPRKVRLVADLVRGTSVVSAKHTLQFSTKRASVPLAKLLKSATSNAKNINENISEDNLFIQKIFVDEGTRFKRFIPASRGRALPIQKKTSHITLVLAEREKSPQTPDVNSGPRSVSPKIQPASPKMASRGGQIANRKKQVTRNKIKNN